MMEEDNQLVPSPVKTSDPKALTSAIIIACTNPNAWHKYAAKELAGWIVNTKPPEMIIEPETVVITYSHSLKGFEIQCLLSVATWLENIGRRRIHTNISVDPFTDKKGITWMHCEYVLLFTPYTGAIVKTLKAEDNVLWFTAAIPTSFLGDLTQINTEVTSTLALAGLRVTSVKWNYDANGTRTGKIHVEFSLANPEEGMPWFKMHLVRFVTLPIQLKEKAAQVIKMELNPNLLKNSGICPVKYCAGVTCGHRGSMGPTVNKRKEKEQERLRIANKYSKGEGSSGYEHPIPRIL